MPRLMAVIEVWAKTRLVSHETRPVDRVFLNSEFGPITKFESGRLYRQYKGGGNPGYSVSQLLRYNGLWYRNNDTSAPMTTSRLEAVAYLKIQVIP